MSAAWRWRVFGPVAEQAFVGSGTALLACLGEGVVMHLRAEDDAGLSGAFTALLGMSLPIGWAIGAMFGLLLALIRETPWLTELRASFAALGRRRRDPRAFANILALAAALGSLIVLSHTVARFFRTHFHSDTLIGWAIALTLPVVVFACILIAALVRPAAHRVAAWAGPLGSGPGAALVLLGALASLLWLLAPRIAGMAGGIHPLPYLWPIGVALTYPIVAWVVRRKVRAAIPAGAMMLPLAAILLLLVSQSYGSHQPVRQLVEQHSVSGQRLVRLYAGLTDRDGDGHASAFGGGDCDDSDAYIHPGAEDLEGDGIDADCFDGDGTRALANLWSTGEYADPPARLRRAPILLVTIDALRPDHLGYNNYERPTSTRIDAFAQDAIIFDQALAPSSRSVRSIPSMMTGQYPSQIGYGPQHLYPAILEENEMLAEVLDQQGYATRACMGSDYFSRVDGFFQGFDAVEQPAYPPRNFPVDCAIQHLQEFEANPARPFLLWVHLYNVHDPYLPDGIRSRYGDTYLDMYDEEIHLADREVGRLMEHVENSRFFDRLIIVMASDHGEAFGEHGNRGHSRTLYEEEIVSTLVMRVPGTEPHRVPGVVSLMDISPTLRNLVGVPNQPRITGRSLVPMLRSEADAWPERPVFMELLPDGRYPFDQKAVRQDDWKLIWWVREGTLRLSNLGDDPGEESDWLDRDPERADRMHGMLRAWMASARTENRSEDLVREHVLTTAPNVQHRLDLRYPGFTVLGYDMPETQVEQGATIPLTFYYRADRRVDMDGYFTLDLMQQGGRRYPDFHGHHYPVFGTHHTDAWEPGQIIRDPVELVVPRDAPVGEWQIHFQVREDGLMGRWVQFVRNGRSSSSLELQPVTITPRRAVVPRDAGQPDSRVDPDDATEEASAP